MHIDVYKKESLLEGKIWTYLDPTKAKFAGYNIKTVGSASEIVRDKLHRLEEKKHENLMGLHYWKESTIKTSKGKEETDWFICERFCANGDITDLFQSDAASSLALINSQIILKSMVDALLFLLPDHHKNIHSHNIVVISQKPLTVALTDIVLDETNLISTHSKRNVLPVECLTSKGDYTQLDWERVDVCMLGFTILAFLTQEKEDSRAQVPHEEFVSNALKYLQQGDLLDLKEFAPMVQLLKDMVATKPNLRPSLAELQQEVAKLPLFSESQSLGWRMHFKMHHMELQITELKKEIEELKKARETDKQTIDRLCKLLEDYAHPPENHSEESKLQETSATRRDEGGYVSEPEPSNSSSKMILKDIR